MRLLLDGVALATREIWWERNKELRPGKAKMGVKQLKKARNEEVAKNCNKPKVT